LVLISAKTLCAVGAVITGWPPASFLGPSGFSATNLLRKLSVKRFVRLFGSEEKAAFGLAGLAEGAKAFDGAAAKGLPVWTVKPSCEAGWAFLKLSMMSAEELAKAAKIRKATTNFFTSIIYINYS